MNTKIGFKQKVIGWILLIILLVSSFFLIKSLWNILISLPKEISAPVIAACATILVSVFSVLISKNLEKKREVEQEHRKQKLLIYEEFMGFWFNTMLTTKSESDEIKQEKSNQFFASFTPKLIVWGPDKFIKEYSTFKHIFSTAENKEPIEVFKNMLYLEKLLYTIRSDIGHNNKNLREGDLLSLFIKDFAELTSQK